MTNQTHKDFIDVRLSKDSAAVLFIFLKNMERLDQSEPPWDSADLVSLRELREALDKNPDLSQFRKSGYGALLEMARKSVLETWSSEMTDELKEKPIHFSKILDCFGAFLRDDPQFKSRIGFEEVLYLLDSFHWPLVEIEKLEELLSNQQGIDSGKYTDRGEGLISRSHLFNLIVKKIKSMKGRNFPE